jgi:hypothetical protein
MVLIPVAVTLMITLQLTVIFTIRFILVITAVFMNTTNLCISSLSMPILYFFVLHVSI